MGQKPSPSVRGITVALRDSGQEAQQGGLEGVLEENRKVEPSLSKIRNESELADNSLMPPAILIDHDLMDKRIF